MTLELPALPSLGSIRLSCGTSETWTEPRRLEGHLVIRSDWKQCQLVEELLSEFHTRISDEGAGFDFERLLAASSSSPVSGQDAPGRGLTLMRHYMTGIRFNARGNSVELWKRRSEPMYPAQTT